MVYRSGANDAAYGQPTPATGTSIVSIRALFVARHSSGWILSEKSTNSVLRLGPPSAHAIGIESHLIRSVTAPPSFTRINSLFSGDATQTAFSASSAIPSG